jgi:hypothetical protein
MSVACTTYLHLQCENSGELTVESSGIAAHPVCVAVEPELVEVAQLRLLGFKQSPGLAFL